MFLKLYMYCNMYNFFIKIYGKTYKKNVDKTIINAYNVFNSW